MARGTNVIDRPVYTAKHRYARLTARKARLVADLIRGRSVNEALETLEYAPQRAAAFYKKLVRSAMANAAQDEGVNVNHLVISDCRADDGRDLPGSRRQGDGARQIPLRDEIWNERLRCRVEEGTGGAEEHEKEENDANADRALPGEIQDHSGEQRFGRKTNRRDDPPIEAIGGSARNQDEKEGRCELEQADQTEVGGIASEVVDLPTDRNRDDLGAELGDDPHRHEKREAAMAERASRPLAARLRGASASSPGRLEVERDALTADD